MLVRVHGDGFASVAGLTVLGGRVVIQPERWKVIFQKILSRAGDHEHMTEF